MSENSIKSIGRRISTRKRTAVLIKKDIIEPVFNGSDELVNIKTVKKIKVELKQGAPVRVKGEPKDWREVYKHVKNMRARIIAPVDTMGCERLPEGVSSKITPKVFRFQLLIALMLSSQTKDEINAIAMENLREALADKGGLTVSGIRDTDEKEIDRLIYKVGFHTRKAHYIKQTVEILREQYDDDVPPTIDEMMSLPGVGPKMAHLLMHRAWGRAEGIGVDVHVHRLANMWKWVPNSCVNSPEKTRIALEQWLPKEYWVDINPALVGFGQTVCTPRVKKCELCDLAPSGLCKAVDRKRLIKSKAKVDGLCGDPPLVDIEDLK